MKASRACVVAAVVGLGAAGASAEVRLQAGAFVSGAARTPTGTVVTLGQPFAGRLAAGPATLEAGIVPALAGTGSACRADFDGSGGAPAVADIFAFLRAWFANQPSADFDQQNGIQVADIFAFLRAWFAGC